MFSGSAKSPVKSLRYPMSLPDLRLFLLDSRKTFSHYLKHSTTSISFGVGWMEFLSRSTEKSRTMGLIGDILYQKYLSGDIKREDLEFSSRNDITLLHVFHHIRMNGLQLILTESRPIGFDGRRRIIC